MFAPNPVSFRVLTDIDILDWSLEEGQSCDRSGVLFLT